MSRKSDGEGEKAQTALNVYNTQQHSSDSIAVYGFLSLVSSSSFIYTKIVYYGSPEMNADEIIFVRLCLC